MANPFAQQGSSGGFAQQRPQNPGNQTNAWNASDPTSQQVQGDAQYNQQLGNWQGAQKTGAPAGGTTGKYDQPNQYGYVSPEAAGAGAMPLPQFQTYNYNPQSVQAPSLSGAQRLAGQFGGPQPAQAGQGFYQGPPRSIEGSQPSAEQMAAYNQAKTNPQSDPQALAAFAQSLQTPYNYGGSSSDGGVMGQAVQYAQQAGQSAIPNVGGLKESAKDTLLSQQKQALDAAAQSAAQRGVTQGGNLGAQQADAADKFGANLADQYRTIDTNAQQQGFTNQQAVANQLAGLSGQGFNQQLAAGQYGLQGQQLAAQQMQNSNQNNLSLAQLAQQGNQFNQTQNLAQQQAALAEYIQRTAAGQNQQQIGQQGTSIANQLQLGTGQLDLSRYLGNQSNAFNLAQLAQQNDQFNKQLTQQGNQFGSSMGAQNNALQAQLAANESNQNNGLAQFIMDAINRGKGGA